MVGQFSKKCKTNRYETSQAKINIFTSKTKSAFTEARKTHHFRLVMI